MELAEVYKNFRQLLLGYIHKKIGNREDAEDILQNVFVKVTANIGTLSDKEKIQNWLYRITRNTIIDYYRSKANKPTFLDLNDDAVLSETANGLIDHTKGLDKCLSGFLSQLPETYKSIVIDSEIKGLRQKELSFKYGLAYPTLRSRVQRGRKKLRQMLVKCCAIETDKRGNILEASPKDDSCKTSCTSCDP